MPVVVVDLFEFIDIKDEKRVLRAGTAVLKEGVNDRLRILLII